MNITVIILIVIAVVSTLGGWLMSRVKEETPVKVLTFMLYFWLLAFVQLIVFAMVYKYGGLDL